MPKNLLGPLTVHADICSQARGKIFGLSIHLHPYFVHASREGSGEFHALSQTLIKKPFDQVFLSILPTKLQQKVILGNKL